MNRARCNLANLLIKKYQILNNSVSISKRYIHYTRFRSTGLFAPAVCQKMPKMTQRVQREETGTEAGTEGRITQLANDRPVYTATYFSAPNPPLEELSVSRLEGQRATNLSDHHPLPTADLPPPYFALENEASDPSQGPPASLYVIRPPMLEPPSYQEAVQMS